MDKGSVLLLVVGVLRLLVMLLWLGGMFFVIEVGGCLFVVLLNMFIGGEDLLVFSLIGGVGWSCLGWWLILLVIIIVIYFMNVN